MTENNLSNSTPLDVNANRDVCAEVDHLVNLLKLTPHIEGGFYKRTFESDEKISTPYGERHAATSIYFLLAKNTLSRWHRLKSFERWFHHSGETVLIHIIDEHGQLLTHRLGLIENGAMPDVDIPPNTWFSAELEANTSYTLMTCMVCPGFDFDDFEFAERNELLELYPEHREIIEKLT